VFDMTCREFGEVARAVARGRGDAGEALAHAAECAQCAALLSSERVVTEALGLLAASAKGRGASERVEAALLEAFARREEPVRRMRVPWRIRLAVAAAVAGMVVGAGVWMRGSRVAPMPVPAVRPVPPAPVVAEAPRQVTEVRARPRTPARVRRSVRRNAVEPAAVPVREVTTQFYPLRYAGDDRETVRGPVLRVQLPRVTLVRFGLPVNQDRVDEPVQADVMLDETGFARAIRFVREQ
jgi:hypothetical protein